DGSTCCETWIEIARSRLNPSPREAGEGRKKRSGGQGGGPFLPAPPRRSFHSRRSSPYSLRSGGGMNASRRRECNDAQRAAGAAGDLERCGDDHGAGWRQLIQV